MSVTATKLGLHYLLLVSGALALYEPDDDVIQLTTSNFKETVLESNDLWLIEFYAPWCQFCQSLAPEWKKAATALKGMVRMGVVNTVEHQNLAHQYNVEQIPAIKVFDVDKMKPEDFGALYSAEAIVDSAMELALNLALSRLAVLKSGDEDKAISSSEDDITVEKMSEQDLLDTNIVVLTDTTFESEVLDSEDMWIVGFFDPDSEESLSMAPNWAEAATDLLGKAKLGAINGPKNPITTAKFEVQRFPSAKMFLPGKKDGTAIDFNGGCTQDSIVQWAIVQLEQKLPEFPDEDDDIKSDEETGGENKQEL